MSINVPKDKIGLHYFSNFSILNQIQKKKKIKIELNEDNYTNQKKFELIRNEARKLKYTKDTSSVIDISLTNKINYEVILQLFIICQEDEHHMYSLLRNRYIIFGEYPPEKKDTTNRIQPIYL